MTPQFDDFDHNAHMRETFALAREAVARGDEPFGSVLVHDDTILMTDSNRENTEADIRRHPELHLAYEREPEETVEWTTTRRIALRNRV